MNCIHKSNYITFQKGTFILKSLLFFNNSSSYMYTVYFRDFLHLTSLTLHFFFSIFTQYALLRGFQYIQNIFDLSIRNIISKNHFSIQKVHFQLILKAFSNLVEIYFFLSNFFFWTFFVLKVDLEVLHLFWTSEP